MAHIDLEHYPTESWRMNWVYNTWCSMVYMVCMVYNTCEPDYRLEKTNYTIKQGITRNFQNIHSIISVCLQLSHITQTMLPLLTNYSIFRKILKRGLSYSLGINWTLRTVFRISWVTVFVHYLFFFPWKSNSLWYVSRLIHEV